MCFWQKVVRILYFHILLSYGNVPGLSLPSCAVAHKDGSAKNAQQWEQKPHREHTVGIFQRTLLMSFLWKLCHLCSRPAQLWGILLQFSLFNTQWKMCSSCTPKTEKEFAFRTLKEILCEGRPCRYNLQVYQNFILLSWNIFSPLKWGFLWKSPNFVAQMAHFQISRGLISHGIHAFQGDNRDNLYNLY